MINMLALIKCKKMKEKEWEKAKTNKIKLNWGGGAGWWRIHSPPTNIGNHPT